MATRAEASIGFRDPDFNKKQYERYGPLYIQDNPEGIRGGKTPAERVMSFQENLQLPPGSTVFEIGPGPGHDARELKRAGYNVICGDIVDYFVGLLQEDGFNSFHYDARKDPIPPGVDAIYAHISAGIHITPKDLAGLLTRARESLCNERAIFISSLVGFGHERSCRSGGFLRDFYLYPMRRFAQVLDQEGVEIKQFEPVRAANGTFTIHAGGIFKKDYKGGSYGARTLHPFGDAFWSLGALSKETNLTQTLLDAQVQAELLSSGARDNIATAIKLLQEGWMIDEPLKRELGNVIHKQWAEELAGRYVEPLMQHAEDVLKPHFRKNTAAALAVCNNNGFSNILTGYEPSWLIEVVAKHLSMDTATLTDWRTESGFQFAGRLTGEVYSRSDNTNQGATVISHQDRLRAWLGSKYRRFTIGVGHSMMDTAFLANTDYPIFAYPGENEVRFAREKEVFKSADGQDIYAGHEPWLKWATIDGEEKLVRYLNMVTSGRFPIQPEPGCKVRRLWTCEKNQLNTDFYKENQIPVHIV